MNDLPLEAGIELICVIVNSGGAGRLIKAAKHRGISGATVMLGHGTAKNRLLDFVGLSDVRKEIVFMVAEEEKAGRALDLLNKEFGFDRPNHGIAFTYPICGVFGTKSVVCGEPGKEQGAKSAMYHSITTIVDRGKAEEVIRAATRAGSKGGTIVNARGSGIHETSKIFAMEIEPEKEIVIILSEAEHTEAIVNSIREQLRIEEPGNGIVYVQDIRRAYGICK